MKRNAGIIVDNDLNDDKRVMREIDILRSEGFNVFVLCFGFRGKKYSDPPGITVTRIRISGKMKNTLFFFQNNVPLYQLMWTREISLFIRANDISIIHAHDLYMSLPVHRAKRKSGKKIPFILDLHENYAYAVTTYNWTKGFLRNLLARPQKWARLEAACLRCADRIIVLSREFASELASRPGYPSVDRFCIFPNVPYIEKADAAASVSTGSKLSAGTKSPKLTAGDTGTAPAAALKFVKKAPVIFYFGIVAERRGIFEALETISELLASGVRVQFLIIGPADRHDRERFFSYINSPSLKESVNYLPWIGLKELDYWLGISDICLAPFLKNPQHESGVANKIYDYMLGSRPVVASDCRPQKNIIEYYSCGLVYGNREEMKKCIVTLLGDAGLRKDMGERGKKAILEDLNISKVRHNLLDCYRELLSE